MRIEKKTIDLVPIDLGAINTQRGLKTQKSKKIVPITRPQFDYLQAFMAGHTIVKIVEGHRNDGKRLHFQEMWQLLELLAQEGMLLNPEISAYFGNVIQVKENFFVSMYKNLMGGNKDVVRVRDEVNSLPFFRVLDPNLVENFLKRAKVIEAPKKIFVCKANQLQRSLFVLLRGTVGVYKTDENAKPKLLVKLHKHSVFGENGFFVGERRTADVITEEECILLQIQHEPSYDEMFASTQAGPEIQRRLRVMHSLGTSASFGKLPKDCFDELTTCGKTRTYAPQEVVFKQGEVGNSVYIIGTGEFIVNRFGKDPIKLGPGDCFGEVSLNKGESKRNATITASAESIVQEISSDTFIRICTENLALACEFERIGQARV